jgi:hypothetical protein
MTSPFADLQTRVAARFTEGLTGVMLVGGTRTAYILERNQNKADPGVIADWDDYIEYAFQRNLELMKMFYDLGGSNLIVSVTSYPVLEGLRGAAQAQGMAESMYRLAGAEMVDFYHVYKVDPYFAALDTLLRMPQGSPSHQVALDLQKFAKEWDYQPGRHKLIWEVAPLPLYTFRYIDQYYDPEVVAELDAQLQAENSLGAVYQMLYHYYAYASYTTDVPIPHFYLASSRNGDLKPRAFLPFSLEASGNLRMYFTPFPSFFMTHDTLRAIFEDLIDDKRLRSQKYDYKGQLTPEVVQQMHEHFTQLAADPTTTLGLSRNNLKVSDKKEDDKD